MPQHQQGGQNAPAQPTAQYQQQQGYGHGQAHPGECAPTLTSPSTLTSFSDRRATPAACCNAACAGEQPWRKHGPNAKWYQRAGATDSLERTQMAQCDDTRQLPGCYGTRWLVIDECVGLGSRSGGPRCKSSMSLCQRATHPDMVI